ncbi:polysaccharide biosynthesis/export family protein [Aquabacter sp. CN5-332]
MALSACSSASMTNAPTATAEEASLPATALALSPGDTIRITVFNEAQLTGTYQIDDDGFVSLPLAGTVKAGGMTRVDFERVLASKLKGEYLTNPKITVEIASFRPYFILGEVEKPGQYSYTSNLNVLSAMAVAGGPTYRASQNEVLIQRGGKGDFKKFPLSPTVMIYPGDLIRVPERFF